MVKNLPAMWETQVQCLGQEDLEKGMATSSSILAWRNPMDRGAWQAPVHGFAKSWVLLLLISSSFIKMNVYRSTVTLQCCVRFCCASK